MSDTTQWLSGKRENSVLCSLMFLRQSCFQSPQASWPAGGHRERDSGVLELLPQKSCG